MTRPPSPAPRGSRGSPLRTAITTLLAALAIAGGAALGVLAIDRFPQTSPQAELESPAPTASLPAGDVAGSDIAKLPRYPGSVRTAFLHEQQGTDTVIAVEYVAGAELDDVRAFYRRIFRENDWELIELDFATGEWIFLVQRGERAVLVDIEDQGARTVIKIELEKPLPAATPPESDAPPPPSPTPAPQPPPPPPDDDPPGDD